MKTEVIDIRNFFSVRGKPFYICGLGWRRLCFERWSYYLDEYGYYHKCMKEANEYTKMKTDKTIEELESEGFCILALKDGESMEERWHRYWFGEVQSAKEPFTGLQPTPGPVDENPNAWIIKR